MKVRGALMFRKHFFRHLGSDLFIILILPLVFTSVALTAERYAVTARIANVRSGPGINHEIMFEAEKYYPVELLKKEGNWYQIVDYESDIGWIHKSLLKKILTVITIKSKCNIRTGPSLNDRIVFVSEKGVPFRVVTRKGKWVRVQHSDGYEGWIHQSLVW